MSNGLNPPNFFDAVRSNHRRSMVLLAGTFFILYAFINLIAAVSGGYTRETDCTGSGYSSFCTTQWYWNPWTLSITAAVVGLYLWIAYLSSAKAALAITRSQIGRAHV